MLNLRIGSAPVTFGVDEVQADGWRPTPDSIVEAISAVGLEGTELGPTGFLGNPTACRALLDRHGLALIAAYLPMRLSRPEHFDADFAWLQEALNDLRERTPVGSSPKAILADLFCEPDRLVLAGAIDKHPETWLPERRRESLIANLHRAAELCQRMGFDAVVHPHAGTYIETESEIRFVAGRLDSSLLGLCLDTGHIRFGGAVPARIAADYAHLIRHVHVKDCDPLVLSRVAAEGLGLKAAVEHGVFCELGAGDVGVAEVMNVLRDKNYQGWVVIEQDRKVAPGTPMSQLVSSLERNLSYLRASAADPATPVRSSAAPTESRPN